MWHDEHTHFTSGTEATRMVADSHVCVFMLQTLMWHVQADKGKSERNLSDQLWVCVCVCVCYSNDHTGLYSLQFTVFLLFQHLVNLLLQRLHSFIFFVSIKNAFRTFSCSEWNRDNSWTGGWGWTRWCRMGRGLRAGAERAKGMKWKFLLHTEQAARKAR